MSTSPTRFIAVVFGILVLGAAGASGGAGYQGGPVSEGGTISGTVRLGGTIPPAVALEITKDEKWCGRTKTSPRFFGKNGGVGNAVISLENIVRGKPMRAENKILLRQNQCEFQPHVVVLPMGSTLEIVNDDPVLHNVRTSDKRGRTIFNIAQPIRGQSFSVNPAKFSEAGTYEVSCDAGHPWMSAHVVVAEHPYYTVTDEKGRFELKDIPEGTYRMRMWHEGIAIKESRSAQSGSKSYRYEEPYQEVRTVEVTKLETITVNFLLVPRDETLSRR